MKSKRIIFKYLLLSMVFLVSVNAILRPLKTEAMGDAASLALAIQTRDGGNIWANLANTVKNVALKAKGWAIHKWEYLRDTGFALAYKKAISYFLKKLAHDTAVYLVTGNKGQGPMFYTESWSDYLKNATDNAAGMFLEELGSNGPGAFDLCNPGLDVTAKIGLGIMQGENPKKPDCTFTEMKHNWQSEIQRKDFLNRFGNMFEPTSNDFGIALSLQAKIMDKKVAEKETATLSRSVNKGFKDVADDISKTIKTPGAIVRSYVDKTVTKADNQYLTYTGFAVADAIDTFTQTLMGTLMSEWLKKGLYRGKGDDSSYKGNWGGYSSGGGSYASYSGSGGSSGSSGSYSGNSGQSASRYNGNGGLTAYNADVSSGGGVNQAKAQFNKIIEPNFSVKGDFDVLNKLVTCTNPVNAKTDECVMTDSFRRAVENKMTVASAIKDGYISKDGVFGFKGDGLEPNFNEGLSYRSMIIMRKYRIIPVGWEIAAQYIKDHQGDIGRTLNISDLVACFDPTNNTNDRYHGYDGGYDGSAGSSWCEGLVDPSWVLKSPQNFCKREGPGPYIQSSNVFGEGDKSKLMIGRDTSYCADEQSCIREDKDGKCEVYGYCLEDRRQYNFGGEACDPQYNTCQAFRSQDGRTMSLLKNTLNYGTADVSCTADNAGCRHYAQAIQPLISGRLSGVNVYDLNENKVLWENVDGSINLDSSSKDCDASAEGCHEFIRTKPGLGTNLLTNASFEEYDAGGFAAWGNIGNQVGGSQEGFFAVQLNSDDVTRSIDMSAYDIGQGSANFSLGGNIFTLSLYVKDCSGGTISIEDSTVDLTADDNWRFISLTHTYAETETSHTVDISITGANGCAIDAMKLERTTPDANGLPTRFVNYREAGLVYEKLIPAYLYESCYEDENNDGFIELKSDAPTSCSDYARYCTASEVNCELYKSTTDDFEVPAVAKADDYCPAECVGYDAYLQSETNFENSEDEYLIPQTAKVCDALSAGCDEFTNLDEVDNPEAREYFINMRRCVNPDSVNTCQPFFMWQGSDETGYQLIVHQLNTTGGYNLEVVNGASNCSTDIADAQYDPNCRDFYDENGGVHTELFYNTVSCTDDCHPYRRTVMDVDNEQNDCTTHGGTWDNNGYCIYMAVPSEGITCQAEEAGCREYNGNTGANTRIVFEHSFENGTNQGWNGGTISNSSVIVGEHSLRIDASASLTLGSEVMQNRSYVLQFLANGAISDIHFSNGNNAEDLSFAGGVIDSNGTWESYKINLDSLSHTVDSVNEALVIAGNVNIDNVRLIEVTDRYYLIEDSWVDSCDHEKADLTEPLLADEGHYAGCDAYTDREGDIHNLYQFNHLCSDSAVGCELMIDTHNYKNYNAYTWFPGTSDERSVEADSYIYAVYDKDKTCNQQDKGCEKLGLEYRYEYPDGDDADHNPDELVQYFDNFKVNNPDMYTKSLCQNDAVLCDAWKSSKGDEYFKNPLDMTCEWRLRDDLGLGQWAWLKKEVKRCDTSGNGVIDTVNSRLRPVDNELQLCNDSASCGLAGDTMNVPDWCDNDKDCVDTSNPDISATCVDNECRYTCLLDETDYDCAVDNTYYNNNSSYYPAKTFGYGGPGSKIVQPLGNLELDSEGNPFNWAGSCPASEDDCTEYVDPESTFSFEVDDLKPFTLYVAGGNINLACPDSGAFYELDNTTNSLELSSAGDITSGDIFYYVSSSENDKCDVRGQGIKKAVVNYQLEHTLDKSICNGMVDLEQGCLLFNERDRSGVSGMEGLMYDAAISHYSIPASPFPQNPGNSNTLLKVSPDRTCNAWLSCKSFIKDADNNDVCYDVGLCKRLDENGNCSYFEDTDTPHNQVYRGNDDDTDPDNDSTQISNMTGYAKIGYDSQNSLEADDYALGGMKQVGQVANVPNGSFELYDDHMYPIGWTVVPHTENIDGQNVQGVMNWERDMFKVISNPVAAQTEGIHYPMDGKAFLKYGAKDSVQSEPISFASEEGVDYILTFYINTKNLASGHAEVSSAKNNFTTISVDVSQDWKKYMAYIQGPAQDNDRIIFSANGSDGNVYVDKVEIKPALNTRDKDDAPWYTSPSCRLYPKSDSLSCDYQEEGGNRVKGLLGYCLEHDRYPGDPNACLMWYPVDRINGDGVEEGGGYIDRKPLYYCVGTADYNYEVAYSGGGPAHFDNPYGTEDLVEDNNFGAQSSGDISITHRNPDGWSEDEWKLDQLGLGSVDKKWLLWKNIDHIRIHETSPSTYCKKEYQPSWDLYFDFDANHRGNECADHESTHDDCQPWGSPCTDPGHCNYGGIEIQSSEDEDTHEESFSGIRTTNWDKECNHPDYQILEVIIFPKVYYCSDVIQTVTPTGQNQYYSANVYEGSNFHLACNNGNPSINYAETQDCTYMSDLAPFGAVSEPGIETKDWAIMSNPYMWDSKEGIEDNQPLFYEIPNGSMFNDSQARMGQSYSGDGVILNHLFRKYYGKWHFDGGGAGVSQVMGHYNHISGASAGGGGTPPSIGTVTTVPSVVHVNQLVNLRFTSDVAAQQLPLTMYMVDWDDDLTPDNSLGGDSVTSVAGIEMRDRPSPDDPHSLYHIYSTAGNHSVKITIRDNWGNLSAVYVYHINVSEE